MYINNIVNYLIAYHASCVMSLANLDIKPSFRQDYDKRVKQMHRALIESTTTPFIHLNILDRRSK